MLPGPHVIQLLAMDAASTAPAADRNSAAYLEAMENTGSYVMVEPYAASTAPAADRNSVDYLVGTCHPRECRPQHIAY